MAVLTAQGIASVAANLLVRSLVLPMTVTRLPGAEFAGSNGDTITVRVPQPGTARTESPGSTLTAADVDEVPVDVTLGHLYHLKNIGDDEASMELESFARQVTPVQTSAVAIGAEDKIATAMNNLSVHSTIEFAATATEADTKATILAAREALGENDVPSSNRFLAVSPSIATRLLSLAELTEADKAGTDNALRNAIIGRYLGFTVVESNALTTDTALAYHRSGFAFAVRTPTNPTGAASSASVTVDGIGLRQVFQYNAGTASDQSLVSTFAGASAVADVESPASENDFPRIVKIGVGST